MNQTILLIAFSLMLGTMTHLVIRHYAPWPAKHQTGFWVAAMAPALLVSFLSTNEMWANVVYSFCGGLVVSEFLRPKFTRWKNAWTKKLQGDTTLYKAPKKTAQKPKPTKPSDKTKRP